jgi:hypothetical protein
VKAMPFNFDQWKETTARNLQGWKVRMERAGVNSSYYFLAGVSLLPIAQAVHSGDWSGLAVLGASLGGAVSTNLLANIVQKSKDKTDAQVAQILEAEVRSAPELKAEMDAMLQKLETLQEAEKALSEADKAWYAETIQQELKSLHSGIKYEAMVIGDGAVAQGSSVSLGANATVHGSITINVSDSEKRVYDEKEFRDEERVLDAAIASNVLVHQTTTLFVLVRKKESKGLYLSLDIEDKSDIGSEDVKSKGFPIEFPISKSGKVDPAEITVKLDSPDFLPRSQEKIIEIPFDGDSKVYTFLLRECLRTSKNQGSRANL